MSGSWWARTLEGRVLAGRYSVDRLVGEGGMGAVFAGTQLAVERKVAVKVLSPGVAGDVTIAERFHREAILAAKIARRGVPQIIDYDRDPDVGPFLVMELLEGESLADRVARRERLHPREACAIAAAVLETLEAVHAKGIVHRDLKPANVFLAREPDGSRQVKVLDFGVARLLAPAGEMTVQGAVLGTPRYMAPEQALGDPGVDARADLYAVGAMLYACLGGKPPYAGISGEAVLAAVRERPPESLANACPDLPPALCAIVDAATAWLPANRFQDAAAMRRAIEAVTRDLPEAPPASVGPASRPPASAQATVQEGAGGSRPAKLEAYALATRDTAREGGERTDDVAAPSTRAAEPTVRRSRLPWAVVAAVLGIAATAAVVRAVAVHRTGAAAGAASGSPGPIGASAPPPPVASADDALTVGLAADFEKGRKARKAGDLVGARAFYERIVQTVEHANVRVPSPPGRVAAAAIVGLVDLDEQGMTVPPPVTPKTQDDLGPVRLRGMQQDATRGSGRTGDVSHWAEPRHGRLRRGARRTDVGARLRRLAGRAGAGPVAREEGSSRRGARHRRHGAARGGVGQRGHRLPADGRRDVRLRGGDRALRQRADRGPHRRLRLSRRGERAPRRPPAGCAVSLGEVRREAVPRRGEGRLSRRPNAPSA